MSLNFDWDILAVHFSYLAVLVGLSLLLTRC